MKNAFDGVKYCKWCRSPIAVENQEDWYRYIALQYCPSCRKLSDQQKTALRVYNLRQRKKQKDKYRDEQLELLKEENELLRKHIVKLREEQRHY